MKKLESFRRKYKTERCPEWPGFGATYPDATCIAGELYDLDDCDSEGNLYKLDDGRPCPFCQPFSAVGYHEISPSSLLAFLVKTEGRYGRAYYEAQWKQKKSEMS